MDRLTRQQFPHVLIRASAGSGKTFQLSNRYLALLNAGVAPDGILATTFTRKAAGEILDRVVTRLAAAAFDPAECAKLAGFIDDESLSCARVRELLHRLLRDLHRLQIGTLDSFFSRLARSLSLEVGLPLRWQIIDELEDARLRDEAVTRVLRQQSTSDLLALTHLLTKGETSRSVGQLVRSTVDDLLTLYHETEAGAWHKLPRPKLLMGDEFAALLEDLRTLELPTSQLERARDEGYRFALVEDWEEFIAKGIAAKVLEGSTTYGRTPIPPAAQSVYQRLIEQARARLVNRVANQTEGSHDLLGKFDREYEALKRARGAAGFDDVTRLLARGLSATADEEADHRQRLGLRLDGHIEHLLLDEFQDTAPIQWSVLRSLAERVMQPRQAGSFFCVGDTKQAIYGWRGGVAEIFDAIEQQLPGLQSQALNVSFRSSPPVIETVNRVFTGLGRHPNLSRAGGAVQEWSRHYEWHTTKRLELTGYVRLETASAADELLAFAAERVAELHHRAPRHQIGVLVLRNDTVRQLIARLRARGISASEEGGSPVTDSAAVQLVLSTLRIADHPGDTAARFHVANSPLGAALQLPDHADDAAAVVLSHDARHRLMQQGYGPTVAAWARLIEAHCDQRERSRLKQLVELAFQYNARSTLRADDFVRFVETKRVSDPLAAPVRVMTVHQAKGLEFDITVLPELDRKLLGQSDAFVVARAEPTSPVGAVCRHVNENVQKLLPARFQDMFAAATDRSATESLCVLYVALTRAMHAMYLMIEPSRDNEKNVPLSYAGLLRAALRDTQPVPPATTIFETGDPDWSAADAVDAPRREPDLWPPPVRLAPMGAPRRRGLRWQSPSAQEGGSRTSVTAILRQGASEAMLRGTILHAWLERIEWLDEGQPQESELRVVAEALLHEAGASLSIPKLWAEFQDMLRAPPTRELLSRGSYSTTAPVLRGLSLAQPHLSVESERLFAVRDGSQLLSGSMDRLVWVRDGSRLVAADVIDFKTDTVDTDKQLREKTDYYRPQLEAYRHAVAKMSGLATDRISAQLLFVGAGRLVTV